MARVSYIKRLFNVLIMHASRAQGRFGVRIPSQNKEFKNPKILKSLINYAKLFFIQQVKNMTRKINTAENYLVFDTLLVKPGSGLMHPEFCGPALKLSKARSAKISSFNLISLLNKVYF